MDDDSAKKKKKAFFPIHAPSDRMYPDSYRVPFSQLIKPHLEATVLHVPDESYSKPPKFRFGYLFGGVIGMGSYATVKEIIHEETLIRRAVKIFDDSKRRKEPKRSESMEREIRVLKRVNHHNVIRFIEMFRNEEKQKTYVVLEFCLGNVAQLVQASPRERLSESDAHFLFIQLIDGLEHLHSLGIVHKDIKPHNLLLTGDFVLKISDFGVSEELSIFQEDDLCTKIFGTLTFQAPEMISSDCFSYSGFKVDIWAAGITLYYMLSGEFPFEGEAVITLMDKICGSQLEMPKSVILSMDAEAFLTSLLEKSPEQRPSIRALRQLHWYKQSFPPDFARFMGAYDAFMKRPTKMKQNLERIYGDKMQCNDEEDYASSPGPGKCESKLLGEHKASGYRVYTADLRHLPYVVPLMKEFYREEPIAKALNVKIEDDYVWPEAYNMLQYPVTVFGVLKNEPVSINCNFVDGASSDLLPKAEFPKLEKNDPLLVYYKFDEYFKKFCIEREGDKKFAVGDMVVIRKQLRNNKLGAFSMMCAARNLLNNDLGIKSGYSIASSKANAAVLQALGGTVVGQLPDSLYVDQEGKPSDCLRERRVGSLCRFEWAHYADLEDLKKKMQKYGNLDKVLEM